MAGIHNGITVTKRVVSFLITRKKKKNKFFSKNTCIFYKGRVIYILFARLAQLAEHLTLNQGVQGSNP